jgi:thimet oligopeptidase
VCNLPGGEPGDPGLCEIDDVNTFFHEFGHLMHSQLAGHRQWLGTSGIRTEHDFVEAPSQMLEEWMEPRGAPFAKD